ncbi:hypothetical protein CTA2_12164 [Colletotrichum tanaceti]|uniref:Uncharacterized protein n=1 Tax=Colletotrichum tanaceti TaxID=1306861 RepID=A0A4U6XKH1_9PEZI|nr:hypothetical protein CTA2_12164 [Colletotrichum tanaceti]TKW55217.1 hypothetical protein CTA1_9421 [Colletotrichum tanaceti]
MPAAEFYALLKSKLDVLGQQWDVFGQQWDVVTGSRAREVSRVSRVMAKLRWRDLSLLFFALRLVSRPDPTGHRNSSIALNLLSLEP